MSRVLPLLSCSLLLACSAAVQAHPPCREATAAAGSVTVEVTDGSGRSLSTYERRGDVWVLGQLGERYRIRIKNRGGERFEAVVSVDGRDAIDGKPASWSKRGYLVPAWGEVTIDGFRLNNDDVAAFRFSAVADSYAAKMGSSRDVGVIGVAVFRERHVARVRPSRPWWGRDNKDDEGAKPSEAPAPTTAEKSDKSGDARRSERPGLGTEFGERRTMPVREVSFVRQSSRPTHLVAVRYDDADGLIAQGIDLDCRRHPNEAHVRRTAKPFVESSRGFATPPPGWDD